MNDDTDKPAGDDDSPSESNPERWAATAGSIEMFPKGDWEDVDETPETQRRVNAAAREAIRSVGSHEPLLPGFDDAADEG